MSAFVRQLAGRLAVRQITSWMSASLAKNVPVISAGILSLLLSPSGVRGAEWQEGAGFRFVELPVPETGGTGFNKLGPATTSIAFTNLLSKARYTTNQTFLNGSGIALGDVDGDGWCDLYVCGLERPNALYRNRGGWRFQDATDTSGLAGPAFEATSAAFADLDGDRDLDLVVSSIGKGTRIFFNDSTGRFTRSGQSELNLNRAAMSMALADIEGDGDLDLYIANYRMISIRDQPNTRFRVSTARGKPEVIQVNGRPVTEPDLLGRFELDPSGKIVEHGEPDALYLNNGKGEFTPASFTDGRFLDEGGGALKTPLYDWGLSVVFRDLNRDGAPDLYVCNDFNSPDRIWINNGQGQFRAIERIAFRTTPLFSMGVDFADVNRDGFDDLFVVDMISRDHRKRHNQLPDILPVASRVGEIENRPQYSRNTLFLNRGDGTFAEIGQFSRLFASEWSWTPVFLDVDLDGYEDVLIATGNERDSMNVDVTRQLNARLANEKMSTPQILEVKNIFARLELPNLAFRNRGDLTFEEVGANWGFATSGVSHGMALGDLDNDGDVDVIVNQLNDGIGIYRNESTSSRLAVRLRGKGGNAFGTGARITVKGGPVPQSQEMLCAGRYLSSDQSIRTFAAGVGQQELTIQVDWRSGKQNVVTNARANRLYEIDESLATDPPAPTVPGLRPLFEDVSADLNHVHHENPFDDFARQPLLPRRLSQFGPGVAWFDLDNDGDDDLVIGSGAGGQLSVFRNDAPAKFTPWQRPPITQTVTRDQSAIVCYRPTKSQTTILAGSSNYEDGLAIGPVIRQYDLVAGVINDRLPGQASSTGPLALTDLDGTGRFTLFVGGRVVPGRYPEAATSMLFQGTSGGWQLDPASSRLFRSVGLVASAVWSDLNQDGIAELILACEAGPLRVFQRQGEEWREITAQLGLSNHLGLWNAVACGDFDSDGRMDFVATNWGWNHRYHNSGGGEMRLYYGDLLNDGTMEVIEAYWNSEMQKVVPFAGFDAMAKALPFIRDRVRSYEAYGGSSVEEILGSQAKSASILRVNTLASMLFLNRGNHFEARPLPLEAQLAPAFGVCVGDMDGDGSEDCYLSQNFFGVQADVPRMDAGRGLWLKGDGRGGLRSVSGQESGCNVYGEQRGCALADYDGDGRLDLVVGQNGASTRLFRNVTAKPGLSVRLDNGEANPLAIGATVQIGTERQRGPAREIRAGSGHWSQDSLTQILAFDGQATKIFVRWPGGHVTESALPKGARRITVKRSGEVVATH